MNINKIIDLSYIIIKNESNNNIDLFYIINKKWILIIIFTYFI